MSEYIAFHKLGKSQLLTLAIALEDQRDRALKDVREQSRKLEAVTSIAVRLGSSNQGEDREIAEDLYAAMGLS